MWQSLASLVLSAAVIMGSPGPSTMSATAVGAAFGLRRSLGYVGGLVLGTTAVLLAVAVGVVAVVWSIPHAAPVLLAISALYILYLAVRIATAPPLAAAGDRLAAPALPAGFFLAAANPKAYLAIAAVFAGSPALGAGAKIVVLAAMIVLIHMVWLSAGATLSHLLQDPVRSRIANVAMAAGLVLATALELLG